MQKMYISTGVINAEDISSGYNVLNPNYISKCVEKSLCNLKLKTLDLVYIHNALESWNQDIDKKEFFERLHKVFEVYEKCRKENKIRNYGMATWTCFRVNEGNKEYLSLEEVNDVAVDVGGKDHGFRFIQLPYNLAYSEALFLKNQSIAEDKNLTILEAAMKLGIGVFSSIPLFQGRLLNSKIPEYAENLTNQVLKLVQIIRSTPGIIAPLLGQKKIEHVKENMKVAETPLLSDEQFKLAVNRLLEN
jgi:aryl-alcohol dehydrogenase-like predicted oxidoreductase